MQGADKNYAPPKARIADIEPVRLPMPREVWIAVSLLYVAIVLIVAGYIATSKSWPAYTGYAIAAVGVLWALVPYFISRRNRVARGVLLALVLIALLSTALNLVLHVRGSALPRPLAWAALVMRVIAVCLLYTKPANAWFNRRP
jgi:hypothetical protein